MPGLVTSTRTVPPVSARLKNAQGGRQIAVVGQPDVDDLAVLVEGPVQVGPPPGDLEVGLADEPPFTRDGPARPARLGELRREPLHPLVGRR